MVAERWTLLLQQEFATQGDMENQVGMETTLFGGPPEIGNVMKLANGQIGFMGMFAHPLFANVSDVIPAMGFAAGEIVNNKSVWMTRIEQEKRKQQLKDEGAFTDGAVSPRSQSPAPRKPDRLHTAYSSSTEYFPNRLLRHASNPPSPLQQQLNDSRESSIVSMSHLVTTDDTARKQSEAPSFKSPFVKADPAATPNITSAPWESTRTSSGVFPSAMSQLEARRPEVKIRKSSNTVPCSLQINGASETQDESTTTTTASTEQGDNDKERKGELGESEYTAASVPLMCDESVLHLPDQREVAEEENANGKRRMPISKFYPAPIRHSSQVHNQNRNSGRTSVPSSADRNSMATSGDRTYSTNLSTTLSPSTEATSFLSVESSDDQVDDYGNGPSDPTTSQDSNLDRTESHSSVLPGVVPSPSIDRIPLAVSNGESRTKSPMKSPTAVVNERGQETVSAWEEGDGERTMRRRISRLRFWRKKMEEDGS
jgi:3',5'-cyclic-nucleotide phosphodiesterase